MLILMTTEIVSSVNVFESNPPSVNGLLTACAGQQISLTCSHNILVPPVTVWRASVPVNCQTLISHNSAAQSYCGQFNIRDSTRLSSQNPSHLNSTADAIAGDTLTGATIECLGGIVSSISVGYVKLCVVGESREFLMACVKLTHYLLLGPPSPPTNPTCIATQNGLNVTWDAVTDTSCARSDVTYVVNAVRESDNVTVISSLSSTETTVQLTTTSGIQPATTYIISVRSTIGHCEGGQSTVTCHSGECLLQRWKLFHLFNSIAQCDHACMFDTLHDSGFFNRLISNKDRLS